MNRIVLSLFLLLLIALAFSQPGNQKRAYMNEYVEADNFYHKALDRSSFPGNSGKTSEREMLMKRQALAGFKNIVPAIEKMHDDSLAFYCYYKIAVLEHSFDSLANAMLYYEKAIALLHSSQRGTKQPPPSQRTSQDSLLFRPYLFTGTIQYNSNQFDPALVCFKKAEAIAAKYAPDPGDAHRLYHLMGTMYYETGNYSAATNYFQKAIALSNNPASTHDTLCTNCQVNLAAALIKLEKFNDANSICNELLKQDTTRKNILHNAGIVNLRLGNGTRAIDFFRRVHYSGRDQVRLLNDMGQAWESMGDRDSARRYYLEAIKENNKWSGKNAEAGLTLKYLGDFDTEVRSFNVALKKYQEALIQFVPDFNDMDFYKNPEQFTGVFSWSGLFSVLLAKANAFEKFYLRVNDSRKIEAALQAYQAAFRLADHVAQTYNGDEARLFLDKVKDTLRDHVIELSMLLYQQTSQPVFLEEAYRFDQLNKVSAFSTHTGMNEATDDNSLWAKEFSLRTAITRLSLKAAAATDGEAIQMLAAPIHDNEMLLRKIQDELRKEPEYTANYSVHNIPSVNQIQKTLDRSTAVASFHLAENGLLVFIITDDKFDFVRVPITPGFPGVIDSFKRSLHDMTAGYPYSTVALSVRLYNTLISPIRSLLTESTRLVIIPGNELNGLPFEALRDKNGRYLIERFAVQYQYSTVLFNQPELRDVRPDSTRVLSSNTYDEQTAKNEGVVKEQGAFNCTDCPGVITSLWKADSKTTGYITRRLDYHLKKGLSKDKALQKAKTDLLSNAEIDPRFKSPVYWAHLVFAGRYQPSPTLSLWWPMGSSVAVSFLIILLANLHSRRKRLRINDLY